MTPKQSENTTSKVRKLAFAPPAARKNAPRRVFVISQANSRLSGLDLFCTNQQARCSGRRRGANNEPVGGLNGL